MNLTDAFFKQTFCDSDSDATGPRRGRAPGGVHRTQLLENKREKAKKAAEKYCFFPLFALWVDVWVETETAEIMQ